MTETAETPPPTEKKEPEKKAPQAHQRDFILRCPANVADKYRAASADERADEKKAREEDKAERDRLKKEQRDREEQERVARRERTRMEQRNAVQSDEALQAALDNYKNVEQAIDPKAREAAHRALDEARAKERAAIEARRAAEVRLAEAQEAASAALEHAAALDRLANAKLPEAKERLAAAWCLSDGAWQSVPAPYRKEKRDRALKNAVKGILGIE